MIIVAYVCAFPFLYLLCFFPILLIEEADANPKVGKVTSVGRCGRGDFGTQRFYFHGVAFAVIIPQTPFRRRR